MQKLPLEFLDGTTPITCQVCIYDDSSYIEIDVGSNIYDDSSDSKKCTLRNELSFIPRLEFGEELWFTVGGQHIPFGALPQDIWIELGPPCGIYQKQLILPFRYLFSFVEVADVVGPSDMGCPLDGEVKGTGDAGLSAFYETAAASTSHRRPLSFPSPSPPLSSASSSLPVVVPALLTPLCRSRHRRHLCHPHPPHRLRAMFARATTRERRPAASASVYLNVYDLTPINGYAYWVGLGVYHSGVQGVLFCSVLAVHGVEYAYGAHEHPMTGIFEGEPRQCPGFAFRKSILIGRTELGSRDVRALMEGMAADYSGDTYNLISKNCNHFCDDACLRLTGTHIPKWVNRLAKIVRASGTSSGGAEARRGRWETRGGRRQAAAEEQLREISSGRGHRASQQHLEAGSHRHLAIDRWKEAPAIGVVVLCRRTKRKRRLLVITAANLSRYHDTISLPFWACPELAGRCLVLCFDCFVSNCRIESKERIYRIVAVRDPTASSTGGSRFSLRTLHYLKIYLVILLTDRRAGRVAVLQALDTCYVELSLIPCNGIIMDRYYTVLAKLLNPIAFMYVGKTCELSSHVGMTINT
ncbi:hypothetical protein ZIOFF_073053 [Zingiber officinale]|uniref:PPPDE domain-containing protein n=1 Tax=Zingiber officinale TaxID=94328 RepID=A0A8J5C8R8_ZINOF|nr:hypothetical protein ZIOFF_073053 [Zingiber officinale]